MKKFFLIALLIFSINNYSQSRKFIYVDENYNAISFEKFKKKKYSRLYEIAKVETDTAIFKKLRFKEFFGNLELKKKFQLNKLFNKRFDIDSAKTWLIHYIDTLPNIKKTPKKTRIGIQDSMYLNYGKIFNDKRNRKNKYVLLRHGRNIEVNKKILLNESQRYSKIQSVTLLHFYNINKGYPIELSKNKWLKDYNTILKKTFTDGMKMYNTIIIHPNGSFYVSSCRKCMFEEEQLLKFKSFKKSRKKWSKTYKRYN